jgi:hypothetical protein
MLRFLHARRATSIYFAAFATFVAFLGVFSGRAVADDTAADELKADVNRLVWRLNAQELSQRTEAEQKLLALGPKILELLPKYSDQAPAAEAQRRETIARIRDRLERQMAEQSMLASTVSLHGTRPLADALAEFSRQTGNKIKDVRQQMGQEAGNPQVTANFDKTPFWQALDQTLDQAGLTVYPYTGKDELGIMALGDRALSRASRASYAGPLRFEATRVDAGRDLRTRDSHSLKLTMEISWEPRLRPITLQQPLSDIHAVDDQGKEMPVADAEGQLERAIDPTGIATEFQLPLAAPPRIARTIATLHGKIRALLPGKIETFEFTDLKNAKKAEQHRAGVTVVLDEVRQDGDAWEVRVRVRFDNAANALESFRSWVFNNEAYLVSADNQRTASGGFETTRQTKDEVGIAYKFDLPNGPGGLKFVYKTPALLTLVPLEYEFKNLPLP